MGHRLKFCTKKASPELLEDGSLASWHISFSGDFPGRIHFIPDTRKLVGIIGYVGKHLSTKDHTTI